MAPNPLFDALEMPGDYLRGLMVQPGQRVKVSQFNQHLGIPSNLGTDMLMSMFTDPSLYLGLGAAALKTQVGKQAVRKLAKPNTYTKLVKSQAGSARRPGRMTIRGEYWLDESGLPTFADGDVGDFNHEAIARMHAQREVISKHPTLWNLAEEEVPDWETFTRTVGPEHHLPYPVWHGDQAAPKAWLDSTDMNAVDARRNLERLLDSLGVDEETWNVAMNVGNVDSRLHAARRWGWTRMQGNNLETYGLTPSKLKKMASGISEAAVDLDEDDFVRQVFDLYDHKTGKFYEGVPLDILEAGDMQEIRAYAIGGHKT